LCPGNAGSSFSNSNRSAEDLIRNPGKQEKPTTRILLMGPRVPGFQIRKISGTKRVPHFLIQSRNAEGFNQESRKYLCPGNAGSSFPNSKQERSRF
jgi:hypothetical protein